MATKIKINGLVVRAVYDDRLMPLFLSLSGHPQVKRATDVEYDEVANEWVATHLATGKVIARGRNRAQVILDEVTWLEENK